MELAKRFRSMLADLGLKPAQAAKMLHVSLRTVHNWISGKHQIPVMAYKLLRMMRYMELPGNSWAGWHFSRGQLVTPEGRTISGADSAWWSQLVRRAHGFSELYQRQKFEKLADLSTVAMTAGGGVADAAGLAGLVPYKTTLDSSLNSIDNRGQDGAIIAPWPTISDFPLLSMPMHENAAHASESALTPSFALPLMPISGNQTDKLPETSRPLPPGTVRVSNPSSPDLRLTPLTRLQLVNPPSSPSLSDRNSPASSDKPANSNGFKAVKVAA